MRKQIAVLAMSALVVLTGCSTPAGVTTQIGLHEQLESGVSLNSTSGHYRAGATEITLAKVVSLPKGQLGFRFVVSSPSLKGQCCSLFPQLGLDGLNVTPMSDGTYQVDVAEDPVSIAEGRIHFHLLGGRPLRTLGYFWLNLSALGVTL